MKQENVALEVTIVVAICAAITAAGGLAFWLVAGPDTWNIVAQAIVGAVLVGVFLYVAKRLGWLRTRTREPWEHPQSINTGQDAPNK